MRSEVFWAFLSIVLLVGCNTNTQASSPQVIVADQHIIVEIADTGPAREQGLMNREHLDPNTGMLFVFAQEEPMTFWMKNTLIPLDILFINNEHIVVSISTMTPCTADPCTLYPSNFPAKYALEVPAGFAHEHSVAVGQQVLFVNV